VTWYRLYNFLLGGREADIIDLNYKKEWDVLGELHFPKLHFTRLHFGKWSIDINK